MKCRTAVVVISAALIVWIASAAPASSATRQVFVLFDERLDLPGVAALDAQFVSTLTSNSQDQIAIYHESMDLSRFDSNDYRALLKNYLRDKYANKRIDVAVACFGPAVSFLLNEGDELFPGTPIVFCGIDRRELGDRPLAPNVRGVLLKREFAPTLEIALGLHPDTKRVVVVAGTSDFDTRLLDQARQEFSIYENRLEFTYLTTLPLQEMLTEVAALPPQTIVLFTTLFQDGSGEPFVPHNVLPLLSEAASAPVYGFLDQYLGRGIVGGSLYSSSAQGAEAAKLVLQVLANPEAPASATEEVSGSRLLFDWRQLQRWKISGTSLPAGSETRFRDLSLWEQYQAPILGAFALFVLQAALIAWLVYEHRRRQIAELESLQRINELAQVNRFASAGEMSASLAHEIRQPLSAIATNGRAGLNWLRNQVPDLDEARRALQNIINDSHRADDIIKSIRAMFSKEPPIRTPINLNELTRQVIAITAGSIRSNNIVLEANLTDDPPPIVMATSVQVQQVILNLIVNAVEAMGHFEHGPRILRISSEVGADGNVVMKVTDSGPGVDAEVAKKMFQPFFTTKPGGMGMGLAVCKTIIEAHGGSLTASPSQPYGMEFQIVLPYRGTVDALAAS